MLNPVESQGWMYACGFEDLDGHRWVMLYMDMSKMPGKKLKMASGFIQSRNQDL